jgi:lipopolysaccharide biosynthesis glycosyltransferase
VLLFLSSLLVYNQIKEEVKEQELSSNWFKNTSNTTAIVTFLAQEDTKDSYQTEYLRGTRLMLRTIKKEMLDLDFIVMVLDKTSHTAREILTKEGAIVVKVDALSLLPKCYTDSKTTEYCRYDEHYKNQFGKLFLWSLVEYKEVVYIDADIFLVGPIAPLFDEIDRETYNFAGVLDYGYNFPESIGLGFPNGGTHTYLNYINGGFLWLKPSLVTFEQMKASLKADPKQWDTGLFEQDFLNFFFGQNKQILDSKYNQQLLWGGSYIDNWVNLQNKSSIFKTTVGWHTKPWQFNIEYVTDAWKAKLKEFDLE